MNPLMKVVWLWAAAMALGPGWSVWGGDLSPRVSDRLELAPPGAVGFGGWIGESITTCRRARMLGQSVPDLVRPFAAREMEKWWRCEFWGKWFTSAALAYRCEAGADLRAKLDEAVGGLIGTQAENGSITSYKPGAELKEWDVWGRKYSLLGLLAYHQLFGDARSLEAARRLADHTLAQIGPGKRDIVELGMWTGMAASSILEPMVLLYRRTGEDRYLEFARYIVGAWEGPKGPDLVRKALAGVPVFKMFPGPDPTKKGYMSGGASKAYEMMSCYEGLLELYRVTGEPSYLEASRKVFESIRDTEITILGSGSSWERWCDGRRRQAEPVPEWMETCVTVTWIKFAAQLLRLTGDPMYADEIERGTYNALLAAQKDDGTWWCHYNPLEGHRVPAPEHCEMHMNCCVANGPRALMLLPALAVMAAPEGPVVNFYEAATATMPRVGGGPVRVEIRSDYPRPGPIEIEVTPESEGRFTLGLRIPSWSREATASVNGDAVEGVRPGSYLPITRLWKRGDVIRLELDFETRRVEEPGRSGRVAIMRGPQVFAVEKRVSVPKQGMGRLKAGSDGTVAAEAVADPPAGIRMAIDVPFDGGGSAKALRMCDYASAGRTWGPESTFRVWLPQPLDLENPLGGMAEAKP